MDRTGRGQRGRGASSDPRSKRTRDQVDTIGTPPGAAAALVGSVVMADRSSLPPNVPANMAGEQGRGAGARGARGGASMHPMQQQPILPLGGRPGCGTAGAGANVSMFGGFGLSPNPPPTSAPASALGGQAGGQGMAGVTGTPGMTDHAQCSKWVMMLQQQLEQAYLERSRILQLAIKLQLENLHLKEALYSENSQRFMQLVQVRARASTEGLRSACARPARRA
jgi:hypothetical protein